MLAVTPTPEPTSVTEFTGESLRGLLAVTHLHGRPEVVDRGPQSFVVEARGAGAFNRVHFHAVDQYQVFVGGTGRVGRSRFLPALVHYVDAFMPYGPIESGPEGYVYVTLRPAADPGARYMPERRDERVHTDGRHHTVPLPDTATAATGIEADPAARPAGIEADPAARPAGIEADPAAGAAGAAGIEADRAAGPDRSAEDGPTPAVAHRSAEAGPTPAAAHRSAEDGAAPGEIAAVTHRSAEAGVAPGELAAGGPVDPSVEVVIPVEEDGLGAHRLRAGGAGDVLPTPPQPNPGGAHLLVIAGGVDVAGQRLGRLGDVWVAPGEPWPELRATEPGTEVLVLGFPRRDDGRGAPLPEAMANADQSPRQ